MRKRSATNTDLPDPANPPGAVSSEESVLDPGQSDVQTGGEQGHHQVSCGDKFRFYDIYSSEYQPVRTYPAPAMNRGWTDLKGRAGAWPPAARGL